MGDFQIQNVVATVNLHQNIHLPSVEKEFQNVEYHPKRFPGLVFRLKRPKTSTLIFSSGKMVCTGATSEKMAKSAVKKVIKELKAGGIIILRQPDVVIQNVVATSDIGLGIDLESAADVMDNVMYEPELFPGLIYRMAEPKVVILLFASGKSVITGAKSEGAVRKATTAIKNILREDELVYSR